MNRPAVNNKNNFLLVVVETEQLALFLVIWNKYLTKRHVIKIQLKQHTEI